MNIKHTILGFGLLLFVGNIYGQTNQAGRLFIPFLDKESQSNVLVTVCDFNGRQPCPIEYSNTLSNTSLFTLGERKVIGDIFVKYKSVTTNSGPTGTVLADLYKTNSVIKVMNRVFTNESWVANFQYTNLEAHEEIRFGAGMLAKFRDKFDDGYNVSLTRTGGGTLLTFIEIKNNLPNGLLARFDDLHAQGSTWDYKLANFGDGKAEEYRHYTDGRVIGKFFMWNPRNGNLMIEAEFKEPYDFEKHRTDLKALGIQPN